jgi:hypothetical protein
MDNKTTKQINYKDALLKEIESDFNQGNPLPQKVSDALKKLTLVELAGIQDWVTTIVERCREMGV